MNFILVIAVSVFHFCNAYPRRQRFEVNLLNFNPSMVQKDGPLGMEELNMLHADAVRFGEGGDNLWFKAVDAKTLDSLITEMNEMNRWFAKVVKYWDDFTSGGDGSTVLKQNGKGIKTISEKTDGDGQEGGDAEVTGDDGAGADGGDAGAGDEEPAEGDDADAAGADGDDAEAADGDAAGADGEDAGAEDADAAAADGDAADAEGDDAAGDDAGDDAAAADAEGDAAAAEEDAAADGGDAAADGGDAAADGGDAAAEEKPAAARGMFGARRRNRNRMRMRNRNRRF